MNDYFGHRWSHVTIAINYSPPPSSLFLETSKRAKNICCRIKLMHIPHSTDSYEKIHLWRIWSHFYWTMNKRHYENWRDSHIFVGVFHIFHALQCTFHLNCPHRPFYVLTPDTLPCQRITSPYKSMSWVMLHTHIQIHTVRRPLIQCAHGHDHTMFIRHSLKIQ